MSDRPRRYWTWVLVIGVIGFGLRLPSLWAGFGMDDFAQLAMVEGVYPVERAPWDLFSFSRGTPEEVHTLMSRGSLAWWSNPELKLSAMRPLASLLFWLDVKVFGFWAMGHHLHTMVWWCALVGAVALLLKTILPGRWALLALFLYVLDECHTYPIGWLANRNSILSACFGALAIWAHVRLREEGWARGRLVSIVCLMLCLSGGEYALCVLALWVCYELVGAPGDLRARLRALVPMFVVAVVWVAIHRTLGFGSYGSNVYVDPVREPGGYLEAVSVRVPILLADMFLAIPTGKLAFFPKLMRMQALLGPLALGVVAALGWGIARRMEAPLRRRLHWLFLGAVISVLPVASSFVSARLLLVPAIAGHAVVAAIVLDAWDALRDRARRKTIVGIVRMVAATALLVAHCVLAPYWGFAETLNIVQLNIGTVEASMSIKVQDDKVAEQRLVVLTAADPMTLLYPPTVRWVQGKPMPKSWWVMSLAPHPHKLVRKGKRVLEMEVIGGVMLRGPVEQLFRRPDAPFAEGDVVKLDGVQAKILQVDDEGRPWKVRWRFDESVDDPSLVFLLATKKGMLRYPMGPVGATMMIPPAVLPMGLDLHAIARERMGEAEN